tara:strand:+ start:68 stop:523 length:456 start_codon:yes stop_codon:yes gene_type:complete
MPFKDKEKAKQYAKQYYKQYEYIQTEKNLKKRIIRSWKSQGLIADYDIIYDRYLNSEKCELCDRVYRNHKDKCMEHNHITCEFRSICCRGCNGDMLDNKGQKHLKNIYYHKRDNIYSYIKTYQKIKYHIDCENKQLALWVKFTHYLSLKNN